MMEHSYYLHTNGDLIYKRNYETCDYRDSNFVKMFWPLDLSSRESAWALLIEALSLGANRDRINELAEKWGCNDEDAMIYAKRHGLDFVIDGNMNCVHLDHFTNIQECPAGFGVTRLEALADFCKTLCFAPTKMNWHRTFAQILEARTLSYDAERLNDLPVGMDLEAPCDQPPKENE